MKKILVLLSVLAVAAIAQTFHTTPRPMILTYEEGGHRWSIMTHTRMAQFEPDQTKNYSVKVQDRNGDNILFPAADTTNIVIQTYYSGTIQIGDQFYKIGNIKP